VTSFIKKKGIEKNMQKNQLPIFIIGCPRSGTTLVRVILDSHPHICCGPEMHVISALESCQKQITSKWKQLKPYGVSKDEFNKKISEIYTVFLNRYVEEKKKKRWAEKTPENIFYVSFIDTLFPNCQFINVLRDGRDVVTSFKKRWGKAAIITGIKQWNKSAELTCSYRKQFSSDRYFEVKYENLVQRPEEETKKMMGFLGEEWTDELLNHHHTHHDFWFNYSKKTSKEQKKEKQPKCSAVEKGFKYH
jgi:hypothetical protein